MKKIIHIISFITLCGMPYCSYRSTAKVSNDECKKTFWGNSKIVENKGQTVKFQVVGN